MALDPVYTSNVVIFIEKAFQTNLCCEKNFTSVEGLTSSKSSRHLRFENNCSKVTDGSTAYRNNFLVECCRLIHLFKLCFHTEYETLYFIIHTHYTNYFYFLDRGLQTACKPGRGTGTKLRGPGAQAQLHGGRQGRCGQDPGHQGNAHPDPGREYRGYRGSQGHRIRSRGEE